MNNIHDIETTYERIRYEMSIEDTHIKDRITWSLSLQAALYAVFLKGGLNVANQRELVILGLITSIASLLAITGAIIMLIYYHRKIRKLKDIIPERSLSCQYPQVARPIVPIIFGLSGPVVVLGISIYYWAISIYDISHMKYIQ